MALKVSGITKDTPNPRQRRRRQGPDDRRADRHAPQRLRRPQGRARRRQGKPASDRRDGRQEALPPLQRARPHQHRRPQRRPRRARPVPRPAQERRADGARQRRPQLQPVRHAARRSPGGSTSLPGKDGRGGPTGVGDVWVRIGPIKFFLDGGMLNGTAYMRQPWPQGRRPTRSSRTTTAACCSSQPDQVQDGRRGGAPSASGRSPPTPPARGRWTCCSTPTSSSTASMPIKDLRFCITHANFPSQHNLERCQRPRRLRRRAAGLALQGRRHAGNRVLGKERIRWFQPYKSWLKYTTIGGGSDHMIKLDPLQVDQPVEPVARHRGRRHRASSSAARSLVPEERLTPRAGPAAVHDQQRLPAPRGEGEGQPGGRQARRPDRHRPRLPDVPGGRASPQTRVLMTIVGGKVVFERKE